MADLSESAGPVADTLRAAHADHRAGRLDAAMAGYRRVLALAPTQVDALNLLGIAFRQRGRLAEAAAMIGKAADLAPLQASFAANLAAVLIDLGRTEDALAAYRRAAAVAPGHAGAQAGIGLALHRLGRFDEALAALDAALAIDADHAEALSTKGTVLCRLQRLEEAGEASGRAMALRPGDAGIANNHGNVLRAAGRHDEAIAAFRAAIRRRPAFAEAHRNLALALLQAGDHAEGWREYEWRWRLPEAAARRRGDPARLWDGGDPAGKRLLLFAEQGAGDTIQFARYAPLLAGRGASVTLAVPGRLRRLMGTLADVAVTADDLPPPEYDFQAHLLDLPGRLGTSRGTIPARTPYLGAEPELIRHWAAKLAERPGLRVGIVWQGNAAFVGDHARSLPLALLAPLAEVPGVRLISLQKGPGEAQLDALPSGMAVERLGPDYGTGPDDFIDTAAAMMGLDVVVTSDTSVAHLAGALDRPGMVLVSQAADWRWLHGGEGSPWYPSLRVVRQKTRGDWPGVIAAVAGELSRMRRAGG